MREYDTKGPMGQDTPLIASLQAVQQEAQRMIDQIDQQRALLYVQQTTNGHSDDDACASGPDGSVTYKDRYELLDRAEESLRENLPPSVVKALDFKR